MKDKRPLEEQREEAMNRIELHYGPDARREWEDNNSSFWGVIKLVWKYRNRRRMADEYRAARRERFFGKEGE